MKKNISQQIIHHIKNHLHTHAKIRNSDITIFLRQLTTFISAGLPLAISLRHLAESQIKPSLSIIIRHILTDIQTGNPLSNALSRHPHHFPPLCCHLIELGEHTGKLENMLETLTCYREKSAAFNKQIKQALFYPCFILLFALIMTFSLLYFVIPQFAILFKEMNNNLPPLTAFIFATSAYLINHLGTIILTLLMTMSICMWQWDRLSPIRSRLIQSLFKLPLLQDYHHQLILTRFIRHLSLTYTAGLTIQQGLPLAANAADSITLTQTITAIMQQTKRGFALSKAMATSPLFPPEFLQFIKIGEEAGKLDTMLDKYASIAEAKLDLFGKRAAILLEPLIMICLGALIGGLVIGMYLPLFKLGSVL